MALRKGFFTALGTPLDLQGNIIQESLANHIENQIEAGASGVLLLGTMGMLGSVKFDQYEIAVSTAQQTVNGRIPLMVGAAHNSLAQIKWRIDILNKYDVCPVLTAPYYSRIRESLVPSFFKRVSEMTDKDIYLYDHPSTTNVDITYQAIIDISQCPNIKGIKTGNIILARKLQDNLGKSIKEDFVPILSNSDLFAMGYVYGIDHYLDGIFASFPKTTQRIQDAFNREDHTAARIALNELMDMRDFMLGIGLRPAFTYAMNLLGFKGNFGADYENELSIEHKAQMKQKFAAIGEIVI